MAGPGRAELGEGFEVAGEGVAGDEGGVGPEVDEAVGGGDGGGGGEVGEEEGEWEGEPLVLVGVEGEEGGGGGGERRAEG